MMQSHEKLIEFLRLEFHINDVEGKKTYYNCVFHILEVMKELYQIVHSTNLNDYTQHVLGIKQYCSTMLRLVVLGE